jgi:CelD/BcsL family acetyltransferase involved in cellulose biosynthesis
LAFSLGPYALCRVPLRLQVTRAALPHPVAQPADLLPLVRAHAAPGDGCLLFGHRLGPDLPPVFRVAGWLVQVTDDGPQYVADLTLGVEAYWARFSGKTRGTLRRKVKAFTEANGGDLDWRLCRTPGELRDFHTHAQALSRQSYQHKLFDHGLPSDEAFVARTLAKAARGNAWGCLLYFQGRPCAYFYLEGEGGVLGWDHVGYDSALARLSPGTVLMTVVMDTFQAMGRYQFMDFGSGESQHKAVFSTDRVRMGSLFLLRPTLKHRLVLAAHRAFSAAVKKVLGGLKRSGLHGWLKKALKQRVAGNATNIGKQPPHDPRNP